MFKLKDSCECKSKCKLLILVPPLFHFGLSIWRKKSNSVELVSLTDKYITNNKKYKYLDSQTNECKILINTNNKITNP